MSEFDELGLDMERMKLLSEELGIPTHPLQAQAMEQAYALLNVVPGLEAPDTHEQRMWFIAGLSLGSAAMLGVLCDFATGEGSTDGE